MRKQSIPGLPSFRGWPGVEARARGALHDTPSTSTTTGFKGKGWRLSSAQSKRVKVESGSHADYKGEELQWNL